MSLRLVISVRMYAVRPLPISCWVCCRSDSVRATSITLAPASASAMAIAFPMPLPAPVTIAVLPSKLNDFNIFYRLRSYYNQTIRQLSYKLKKATVNFTVARWLFIQLVDLRIFRFQVIGQVIRV